MKKLVLGIVTLCLVASTPAFAAEDGGIVKSSERVAATNFSVKVNSGSAALVGATVKLFQAGVEIGSAVTNSRGIAALSVPNQEAVTVKVSATGYTPKSKEAFIPSESEIVAMSLSQMILKPTNQKVKARK
ncbi:MAG: hypothetical protein ACI9J3_001466 [Parvicellaceae bacterium]|jgi:hypothetical protein